MLGFDMSWASFHVVEVMSSAKIHLKSVGYLAAAQSFNQDTDVLMLTTNLLKKARRRTFEVCVFGSWQALPTGSQLKAGRCCGHS